MTSEDETSGVECGVLSSSTWVSDIGPPPASEIRSAREQRTVLTRLEYVERALCDLTPGGATRERERLVATVNELEARVSKAQGAYLITVDNEMKGHVARQAGLARRHREIERLLQDERAMSSLRLNRLQDVRETILKKDITDLQHLTKALQLQHDCQEQRLRQQDDIIKTLLARVDALELQARQSGHWTSKSSETVMNVEQFKAAELAIIQNAGSLLTSDVVGWEREAHRLAGIRARSFDHIRTSSVDSVDSFRSAGCRGRR